jgi:putative restriction endonuclease
VLIADQLEAFRMAYWWVNQGQTWKQESRGGYLWAPMFTDEGKSLFHWDNMDSVSPGDIVFSYVDKKIRAVSTAGSAAYPSPRPAEFGPTQPWQENGRRLELVYELVEPPFSISGIQDQLLSVFPEKYAPLKEDGGGNQGYLYNLPPKAGDLLLDKMGIEDRSLEDNQIAKAIMRAIPDRTVRKALLDSRVGQGQFRNDLMKIWHRRCAVTGLDLTRVLRASHIKPWRASNNGERLDPRNGLLLSPNYDGLFDVGYITFDESGAVMVSNSVKLDQLNKMGIDLKARIADLHPETVAYLSYHRANLFKTGEAKGAAGD